MKAVKTLLTVLLCMAMVALSGGILGTLLLFGSGQTGSVSTVETDLGARYGNAIHNQLADALAGIASVKKTYWIAADAPAAPEPDPQRYGTTDDPQSLGWLLEEAKDVLEGQDTYFSTEVTLLPGSEVHYYLDETILAITWKPLPIPPVSGGGQLRLRKADADYGDVPDRQRRGGLQRGLLWIPARRHRGAGRSGPADQPVSAGPMLY